LSSRVLVEVTARACACAGKVNEYDWFSGTVGYVSEVAGLRPAAINCLLKLSSSQASSVLLLLPWLTALPWLPLRAFRLSRRVRTTVDFVLASLLDLVGGRCAVLRRCPV
jgi:hypothetical protein